MLLHQYVDNSFSRFFVYHSCFRNTFHYQHQIICSSCIIQAQLKRFVIFHATQYRHIFGADAAHGGGYIFGAHQVDDIIGGQVAAFGDHAKKQIVQGKLFANMQVKIMLAVIYGIL